MPPATPIAAPAVSGNAARQPPPPAAKTDFFSTAFRRLWQGFLSTSHDRRDDWRGWLTSLMLHAALALAFWLFMVPRNRLAGDSEGTIILDLLQAGDALPPLELADSAGLIMRRDNHPFEADNAPAGAAVGVETPLVDVAETSAADLFSLALINVGEFEGRVEPKAADARDNRSRASRGFKGNPIEGQAAHANLSGILEGRGATARPLLVRSGGGTDASENAVELGLQWLARHQRSDGSWSFQHGPDDPGILDCPTGATGMALLAFLGAGYTHKDGRYRSHVAGGLKYLVDNLEVGRSGGWLKGTGQATMYVQGIGAIALCEAYALTKDAALRRPAQLAIDFIVKAQDSHGGGWRYQIPQAGDTSVVGWQLMALHSALIAELEVPPIVFERSKRFLRTVESDGGGLYGYMRADASRPSTTAVGLLCRMYLGREPSHNGMQRGIKHLSEWGPNVSDMYYSYYATQVLHHWGGLPWTAWNGLMRDQLVNSQARTGNSAGSWVTDRSHGAPMGGRLYTTCLSIMTLEVYYRYLSIYRRLGSDEEQ
ncbi:MAG: prenyltransferase/squalene oxidase repeat-containing protein [Planctomycetaceae bacterium]